MALDPTTTDYDAPMYCPRHPKEQTYLRCGKCERPICAKCRVSTPVGFRCIECANLQVLPTYAVPSTHYVKSATAGLVVAALIGVIMGYFPDFEFWTALIMGLAVPEAVAVGANQKRGPGLQMVGVACIVVGFIISRVVMNAVGAFSFSGISALDNLPFYLTQYSILWLALMIFLAYKRLQ